MAKKPIEVPRTSGDGCEYWCVCKCDQITCGCHERGK